MDQVHRHSDLLLIIFIRTRLQFHAGSVKKESSAHCVEFVLYLSFPFLSQVKDAESTSLPEYSQSGKFLKSVNNVTDYPNFEVWLQPYMSVTVNNCHYSTMITFSEFKCYRSDKTQNY